MRYAIIDLETGSKKEYLRKGNPLTGNNNIVAVGMKMQGLDKPFGIYNKDDIGIERLAMYLGNFDIIVGHNIKFDLLHLWKYDWLQDWLKSGGKVFDTSIAEYMITGQQHKYPALRDIAVNKYGCQEREKFMEDYWDRGFDTGEIPPDLVLTDVKNDVLDTEQVMLQQIPLLKKHGMYKLSMEMMEGLLATTEMEYNGIYVDQKELRLQKKIIQEEIEQVNKQLHELSKRYWYET